MIACTISLFVRFLFEPFAQHVYSLTEFDPAHALRMPWTLFTYPIVQFDLLILIFSGLWLWFVGSSLERSWGTGRFAAVFFGLTAAFALGISLGSAVLKLGEAAPGLWGLYPSIAGLTVAWCTLMPEQSICVWPITLRAKYLAIVVVVVVWYYGGKLLGIFAELGPLAGYLYVRYGRSWGAISHQTQRSGRIVKLDFDRGGKPRRTHLDGSTPRGLFDIAGRVRDMQERRRLEKLLRNSGIKEPDWIDEDRKYNP